jgi:SIR2-like domain
MSWTKLQRHRPKDRKCCEAILSRMKRKLAEGRKRPSAAHKAIAQLIANGYIRVVVTTNFDRLLEQALAEIGIQPVVISTADSIRGALPLAHSPCSIIKVNGDYLDTRLKNTRGELEKYEEQIDALLDRVFDEYGVIVAGWSAQWDIALSAAFRRCPNRRFAIYWAQRGSLTPEATSSPSGAPLPLQSPMPTNSSGSCMRMSPHWRHSPLQTRSRPR